MKNGTQWLDTAGNPIQAHGGMILEYEGTYYWYGENKNGPTLPNRWVGTRIDLIGVSCYSSRDLKNWKYEGLALSASQEEGHDLHPSMVCERPKVLYNKNTKEFVMWMHIDREDYSYARAGVAVSDSPTGPFTYLESFRPATQDCRDMTLYQEEDGSAYLIFSSDWNKTLRIARLTDDYKSFTGLCTKNFIDQSREAPAVFKYDGQYFCLTSGCTGWEPNAMLYAVSDQLLCNWKLIDNPLSGPNARKTFFGQSSYVFFHNGSPYLLLDHWKPDDLCHSGYSFLKIHLDGDYMEIPWTEETEV